jgi:hypothetical protein
LSEQAQTSRNRAFPKGNVAGSKESFARTG